MRESPAQCGRVGSSANDIVNGTASASVSSRERRGRHQHHIVNLALVRLTCSQFLNSCATRSTDQMVQALVQHAQHGRSRDSSVAQTAGRRQSGLQNCFNDTDSKDNCTDICIIAQPFDRIYHRHGH